MPEIWDSPDNDPGFERDGGDGERLVVDIEGYQGPLDLLLALARTHKIDIAQISILELVEQYLSFIDQTKTLHLEVVADYLVMAAWLAFLKSKLLLPVVDEGGDEPTGEELAARLAFRLQRLSAMRQAAETLMGRQRLGVDVFQRGAPEGMRIIRQTEHTATIYDLLKAYADQRNRSIKTVHVVKARTVWSIKDARERLERLIGSLAGDWKDLRSFIESYLGSPEDHATVVASSLSAALEMTRDGKVELRQEKPFGPIYVRRKEQGSDWVRVQ